jgi:hypothetical protein
LGLVSISNTSAPAPSTVLRSAIDRLDPMTFSSIVVSLVRREMTSPVRVTSKSPARASAGD